MKWPLMGHSKQVEAGELQPWTTYNYQFTVCGSNNSSPIGRTKTSPASDADVDEIKLAVFSCSNYRGSSIGTQGLKLYIA
jgi:alkaline phosphatase D